MSTDTYIDPYRESYWDSYTSDEGVTLEIFARWMEIDSLKYDYQDLQRNLEVAATLIDTYLGVRKSKVPEHVYVSVHLMVAQQLYYADARDTSTSGQYAPDGTFITARPKDPMHYAYPILRKFVGWF